MSLNPLALDSAAVSVDDAILSRMSVRAFLPRPVEREKIEHILELASRPLRVPTASPGRCTCCRVSR